MTLKVEKKIDASIKSAMAMARLHVAMLTACLVCWLYTIPGAAISLLELAEPSVSLRSPPSARKPSEGKRPRCAHERIRVGACARAYVRACVRVHVHVGVCT